MEKAKTRKCGWFAETNYKLFLFGNFKPYSEDDHPFGG
jgi:hypothetical protein